MLDFLLPVIHLLIYILNVSSQTDTLSCPCQNHACPPSFDQSTQKSLAFVFFLQSLFDNSSEVEPSPNFLNQSGTEIPNLFLKRFLLLFAGLTHHENQILDHFRLFPTIGNTQQPPKLSNIPKVGLLSCLLSPAQMTSDPLLNHD